MARTKKKQGSKSQTETKSPFRLGEPDLSNVRELQELLGEVSQVAAVRRGIREYVEILRKNK